MTDATVCTSIDPIERSERGTKAMEESFYKLSIVLTILIIIVLAGLWALLDPTMFPPP
jgi:hypothetical protein